MPSNFLVSVLQKNKENNLHLYAVSGQPDDTSSQVRSLFFHGILSLQWEGSPGKYIYGFYVALESKHTNHDSDSNLASSPEDLYLMLFWLSPKNCLLDPLENLDPTTVQWEFCSWLQRGQISPNIPIPGAFDQWLVGIVGIIFFKKQNVYIDSEPTRWQ